MKKTTTEKRPRSHQKRHYAQQDVGPTKEATSPRTDATCPINEVCCPSFFDGIEEEEDNLVHHDAIEDRDYDLVVDGHTLLSSFGHIFMTPGLDADCG